MEQGETAPVDIRKPPSWKKKRFSSRLALGCSRAMARHGRFFGAALFAFAVCAQSPGEVNINDATWRTHHLSCPGATTPPSSVEWAPPRSERKVAVLVMVHNEGNLVREFVTHYLEEGVDHIFILDDNSTDHFREELACIDERAYTVWPVTSFPQLRSRPTGILFKKEKRTYNYALHRIRRDHRNSFEWLIVVDADEFFASRACPHRTVADILLTDLSYCDMISAPWILYSWGNQSSEPCGDVRRSLTWRWGLDARYRRGEAPAYKFRDRVGFAENKYAVRLSAIQRLGVHSVVPVELPTFRTCRLGFGAKIREYEGVRPSMFTYTTDASVHRLPLAVFHYRLTSWLRWRVKSDPFWQAGKYAALQGDDHMVLTYANRMDIHDPFLGTWRRRRARLDFSPARTANCRRAPAAADARSDHCVHVDTATPPGARLLDQVGTPRKRRDLLLGRASPCAAMDPGRAEPRPGPEMGPYGMQPSVGMRLRLVDAGLGNSPAGLAAALCAAHVSVVRGEGRTCPTAGAAADGAGARVQAALQVAHQCVASADSAAKCVAKTWLQSVDAGLTDLAQSGAEAVLGPVAAHFTPELLALAPGVILVQSRAVVASMPAWAAGTVCCRAGNATDVLFTGRKSWSASPM